MKRQTFSQRFNSFLRNAVNSFCVFFLAKENTNVRLVLAPNTLDVFCVDNYVVL